MAKISQTPDLKKHYKDLFNACQIRSEKVAAVEKTLGQLLSHQGRYRCVDDGLDIPWYRNPLPVGGVQRLGVPAVPPCCAVSLPLERFFVL